MNSLKPVAHPFNKPVKKKTNEEIKHYLGGKGAGLNNMYNMGVNVPPGFTIPTIFCESYQKKTKLTIRMEREIHKGLEWMGEVLGRNFLSYDGLPMLLSVRSGAPISMPGMMDTILNLGMNAEASEALSDSISRKFALDSYRRFLTLYSSVIYGDVADPKVKNLNHGYEKLFGSAPDNMKERALERLIPELIKISNVPTDPWEQLNQSVLSVFKSWNTERAHQYREIENIPHDLGTAVTVQAMVYGNQNNQSGTGVMFTMNPNTGENVPYGDFLPNAQGEDVVSGQYKTLNLEDMKQWNPEIYNELMQVSLQTLQPYYRDMLDIEFTIEDNRLYILQARVGKRTAVANSVINATLLDQGLITPDELESRNSAIVIPPETKLEDSFEGWTKIATGIPACPGIVEGPIAIDKKAISSTDSGYILVRPMTEPDDVPFMKPAVGIVTSSGGVVSHAAVVARSWNKSCIVGASDIVVSNSSISISGYEPMITEGTIIKIDGATGNIYIKDEIEQG